MAKQCYCPNYISVDFFFCEIVCNLLEDLLHQHGACTVTRAQSGWAEAASGLQKIALLRFKHIYLTAGHLEQQQGFPLNVNIVLTALSNYPVYFCNPTVFSS